MRCPKCGWLEDKVIESRVSKDGAVTRRRRVCDNCSHRFTTRETIGMEIIVVKRDGTREDYDSAKIHAGIRHACWKRTVSEAEIDELVAQITRELVNYQQRELPSSTIGELVMDKLQNFDEVAFVRFASIYRRFHSVGDFVEQVRDLKGQPETTEKPNEND